LGVVALGGAVVDRVPVLVVLRPRGVADLVIRGVAQAGDDADELPGLEAALPEPREALGVVAQVHPELGVGPELEHGGLHALGAQVIAGDRVAAEEEGGLIDDEAEVGGEVVGRQPEGALPQVGEGAALGIPAGEWPTGDGARQALSASPLGGRGLNEQESDLS
ncbi:MAG: hypothetical protein ACK55I_05420, partial [bacterium]